MNEGDQVWVVWVGYGEVVRPAVVTDVLKHGKAVRVRFGDGTHDSLKVDTMSGKVVHATEAGALAELPRMFAKWRAGE